MSTAWMDVYKFLTNLSTAWMDVYKFLTKICGSTYYCSNYYRKYVLFMQLNSSTY